MNCEHVQRVLDAFVDGELDAATHAEVQAHLPHCDACLALKSERDVLRQGFRRLARHEASPQLRAAIEHQLDEEVVSVELQQTTAAPRRWSPSGPFGRQVRRVGAGVMVGFVMGLWLTAPRDPVRDLREPVIALHVASFENGAPRIEVASSDRHVVKPWFAGKLDFAPTVRDLSEHGFALIGGRLDTLGGQPAAVLAYRIRRHQISLVIARSTTLSESPLAVSTLRGFAVATWAHDGLTLSAIADVDARELQRFAELVSGSARP